jgi:uncharacterized protein YfdQ (DUF2303 family)
MPTPDPNWKPQSLGVDLTVIERLTVAATSPRQLGDRRQVVVLQKDQKVETIPALYEVPLPDHIRQNVTLVELASFIAYIKQFGGSFTRIFGTTSSAGARFRAIIDYHEGGKDSKPGHGQHVATYAPQFSDEFAAWHTANSKPHTQEQFLEHLRRWGYVVTSHTDADLIELISSLEFNTNGQFASKIERTRGGRQLTWNEVVEGTGQVQGKQVTVPDAITIKLPIFLGGREYEAEADLLYRVASGRLTIAWEIKRQQKLIFEAVKDLVKDVEEGTDRSVFIGETVS